MVAYQSDLHASCLPFLEEGEARQLLGVMDTLSCKRGSELFAHGDRSECMYFIVSGRVAVQNRTGFGDRTQVIALLDAGAPIGERGILGNVFRGARVTVVEDAELLRLSLTDFADIVKKQPFLAVSVLRWLLDRATLRLQKSSERLARVL